MRILPALLLAALLAVIPTASATVTVDGYISQSTPFVFFNGPVSNPVLQNADTYTIAAGPGTRVVATLTYADTSGNPVGNDLDLALGPPSTPPTPLLPDPARGPQGVLDWATLTASATLVRAQCGNFVAQSHNHFPYLNGNAEHIDYTVPSGGESGVYRLTVTGFLVTRGQPYTLAVTVLNAAGADVTASTLGPQQYTPFVRTSAACQLLFPPP